MCCYHNLNIFCKNKNINPIIFQKMYLANMCFEVKSGRYQATTEDPGWKRPPSPSLDPHPLLKWVFSVRLTRLEKVSFLGKSWLSWKKGIFLRQILFCLSDVYNFFYIIFNIKLEYSISHNKWLFRPYILKVSADSAFQSKKSVEKCLDRNDKILRQKCKNQSKVWKCTIRKQNVKRY